MRGALIVCIVMLVRTVGCAQQLSQYTQYVFNQFSINPAVAGSKDCLDVRLGFRQQWVGLPGAPTTGWASLHASLEGKNKPFQNNKHGIGMFVEADQAGNWGYTRFLLAYAYHIQMSKDYYMALGTYAGVQQMKFDVGEAFLSDAGDPALDGKATSLVVPDISPGIWVYGKRFWGGLALQQALGNKIKNIGTSSKLARHFKLSAGYRFKLEDVLYTEHHVQGSRRFTGSVGCQRNDRVEQGHRLGYWLQERRCIDLNDEGRIPAVLPTRL